MKKLFKLLLAGALTFTLLGCSSSNSSTSDKVITVAASPTPHAEILAKAAEILKDKGWTVKVTEFEDYIQPINVVESGEIDCNYFAHSPYINNYNDENKTNEVILAKIHYEPFGIYPGTKSDLADLADGDTIVIPNDGTNETRALLLLQDNGIITLPEGTDSTSLVTVLDIQSYTKDVEIVEVEAAVVSHYTSEAAFVVLNGNYALAAGLNVSKDAVAYELASSDAASTYANVIVVTKGNEDNEGVKALIEVLQSKEIQDFINEKWEGSVIPYTA